MADFTSAQKEKLNQAVRESHLAIDHDKRELFRQACQAYEKSVGYLSELINSLPPNHKAVPSLRAQIENYSNRANVIKHTKLEFTIPSYAQQRSIPDNGTGFSYESIFEPVLNLQITSCRIEEPYLEKHHQLQNLIRFCEMLVRRAPALRTIKIITKGDALKMQIGQLAASLHSLKGITLTTEYVPSLHDRVISFNTGAVVKMGRGLHIYKSPEPSSIGTYDLEFRPCHEGKIDIIIPQT